MNGYVKLLKSKIHRATVTHADINYEGSLTVPQELMKEAGFFENEAVAVWNVTTGSRFETYAITGESGSRVICANGAAAHLASPGDLVIIATFCYLGVEEAGGHCPVVVLVDGDNVVK